jgi:hypothetical protein
MIKQDLEATLRAYSGKASRSLPVCANWNGKRKYVSVRDKRDANTIMLELTDEFKDTTGVINGLLHYWENPNASVFVDTGGGILREIQGVGLETRNWSGMAGWEECVLIDFI